jgi:mRNA interferase MazF
MVKYTPERGDIVWLNFYSKQAREIQKTRPALVISPKKYNAKTGLAMFMPITSQIKKYPFEIDIVLNGSKGVILCDQIRSLDWKVRKTNKISTLDKASLEEALSKLSLLLYL